jgi:hypothetical protein
MRFGSSVDLQIAVIAIGPDEGEIVEMSFGCHCVTVAVRIGALSERALVEEFWVNPRNP